MPEQVLLLTAAINPSPDMHNNQRSDPTTRMNDYLEALDFYLDALPPEVTHILFCENTLADLAAFEAMQPRARSLGKQLHLLSFKGQVAPRLGKGVCEFEILDVAYTWLAEHFEHDTIIWKVTGRLKLKNIAALVRSWPVGADIYADMRSVPMIGEKLGGNDWAEMRVMGYRIDGYGTALMGKGEVCGYVTEKGLFRLLQDLRQRKAATVVPRFKLQPRFSGICGGSSKSYESLECRAKDGLRSITRTILPSLWL